MHTLHHAGRSWRPRPTRRRLFALVASAGLLLPAILQGQSADEQSAYLALIYTPVAGLPPLAPRPDTGNLRRAGVNLIGRVGHQSRRGGLSLTSVAAGIEVPMGRWDVGGTIAYLSASCGALWAGEDDCAGDVMFGGTARTTLLSRPLENRSGEGVTRRGGAGSGRFLLGIDASAGFSPRQGDQALAASIGMPLGILLNGKDIRVLPFVTPGLGYGRLGHVAFEGDAAYTAHGSISMLVGGGFGLEFRRTGVGANVGFQRVMKSNGGSTQLGIGMTWKGFSLAG